MKKNQPAQNNTINQEKKIRLDKWLWAARFYKTRALATEAIKGGKVHLNDARIKPSHIARIGEQVRVRKEQQEQTIIIDALSEKRGSATIAQTLYTETSQSIKDRETMSDKRRALYSAHPSPQKRPNKKQRRNIIKFKQENYD
ncbi:MAG: S4 domain-containing protein [Pseudomonadota bacterium]